MATLPETTTIAKEVSTPADKNVMYTILPYAIGIAAQLPLLFLYFSNLWSRVHYQWFPFAFLATGALIWMRWPAEEQTKFVNSWWSNCLLVVGVGSGILGAMFVEPWFAASECVLPAHQLAGPHGRQRQWKQHVDRRLTPVRRTVATIQSGSQPDHLASTNQRQIYDSSVGRCWFRPLHARYRD